MWHLRCGLALKGPCPFWIVWVNAIGSSTRVMNSNKVVSVRRSGSSAKLYRTHMFMITDAFKLQDRFPPATTFFTCNFSANVFEKLGVHTRAKAVVWARERGLDSST